MPSALSNSRYLSDFLGDMDTWSVIVPSIPDPLSAGVAVRLGVAAARWALLIKDCGSPLFAVNTHIAVCLHIAYVCLLEDLGPCASKILI